MESIWTTVSCRTWRGPYAPLGVQIVKLANEDEGIEAFVQPDNGMDFPEIRWPSGSFIGRRVEGGVASGRVLASEPALMQQLQGRVGAWFGTINSGNDDLTGLHPGLVGIPSQREEWEVDSCSDGLGMRVGATYRISNAPTGNPAFNTEGVVTRSVSLAGRVLTVENEFQATRECTIAPLEHINPRVLAGSRVLMPWDRVNCIVDRDGVTPEHMNPFREVEDQAIRGSNAERCFFTYIEPSDNGVIPVCLLQPDGTSLGFEFSCSAWDRPMFVMIWYSPSSDDPDMAIIGVEPGVPPLGGTRTNELDLRPTVERAETISWEASVIFNGDQNGTDEFVMRHGIITTGYSGPKQILPDWARQFASVEDYDQKVAEFLTLRYAAGLIS